MHSPKQPLQIVMVLENNYYPSDTRVRNEAQTLSQAGHQVTVICPRKPDQPRYEELKGVRIQRFPHPPAGNSAIGYMLEFGWGTFFPLIYVLIEWLRGRVDVVHVHNPPDTLFVTSLLPKLFGAKLVYDHHDLAPELYLAKYGEQKQGKLLHRWLLTLERWTSQFANRVITVNESYKQNDIRRNHVHPDHIHVVRNGPPQARTDEVIIPDADLQRQAETLIGYLGNISHQDGVDHLLRALYHLEHDFGYANWYAVIIGPADNLQMLTDLAAELGITDKLWFAGYQPEDRWRALLAATHICIVPDPVNPLNEHSTMIKTMDYMALGKPVVAYDMVENRVSGGTAAFYAQPNDPLDMARHIYKLVQQPALRQEMGEAGKKRVRDSLAWEYSAAELLAVYNKLAEQMRR